MEGLVLDDKIKSCWSFGQQIKDLKDVVCNLDRLMNSLHCWSREHIGCLPRKLDGARKRLFALLKRNDLSAILERKKILR